ncbi:Rieske 2Fe-2S domain-containing protein [Bradyrhizobium denitrificans]
MNAVTTKIVPAAQQVTSGEKGLSYRGYYKHDLVKPDYELTSTMHGTPMGEYMRRFWQPVCLSEELKDLPKAIRILGEDLVAYRDRSGNIGVLHRYCAHRGASLEYGIIGENGIRCCYHGWAYGNDGRLLEAPCEPDDSRLKKTVCQGAYPAFERDGLVFAYMGPSEMQPPFPEFSTFTYPKDNRLVPFSNIYPCNWLQVYENIMDHMHTAVLHNRMVVSGTDDDVAKNLSLEGFGDMPVMQWEVTRDGNGIVFIAGRRLPEDKVWIRITEMIFPNFLQIGSLFCTGGRERHGTTGMTRWNVPVDDEHMIIFGYRHFNSEVDPDGLGCEEDCGVDKIDFLDGQVGDRTYEEGQRAPGDWEAIVSQGKIASHGAENPGFSDTGVYKLRKQLRDILAGKVKPYQLYDRLLTEGKSLPIYTQDTVLNIPELPTALDRKQILDLGKKVLAAMQAGDEVDADEREEFIRREMDKIDGGCQPLRPAAE